MSAATRGKSDFPALELPLALPYPPMEAATEEDLPTGGGWLFEPKWDGFRCLAFRDRDRIVLQSKAGRPLGRYFPDVVEALATLGARRFVLDGELVVPVAGELSFDELQLRLHPAESRVRSLASRHPARFLVFDLLATERRRDMTGETLAVRRERLERFAARYFPAGLEGTENAEEPEAAGEGLAGAAVRLSPATTDRSRAQSWYEATGTSLDGVVAKRLDLPYRSGERDGMLKVKTLRTADCVVGGFRYGRRGSGRKNDGGAGSDERGSTAASLLLGLYDEEGRLDHVGFTSSLDADAWRALTPELEALRDEAAREGVEAGFSGSAPGGPSRWSRDRDTRWEALPPRLVAEVVYDHFSGGRFRHGTRFLRFRPDKPAADCTYRQIPPGARLGPILAAATGR